MNKVKSFWEQFDIGGNEMLFVLNRLRKKDVKDLSNQEKINLIKKIYKERMEKDKKIIDENQKLLNKLKLKMQIENNKLVKIKAQDNFFKCEDKIQNFEDYENKLKDTIKKRTPHYQHNLKIYQKLDAWKQIKN